MLLRVYWFLGRLSTAKKLFCSSRLFETVVSHFEAVKNELIKEVKQMSKTENTIKGSERFKNVFVKWAFNFN